MGCSVAAAAETPRSTADARSHRVASLIDVADGGAPRDPRLPDAGRRAALRPHRGAARGHPVAREPEPARARAQARRAARGPHEPPGGADAGRSPAPLRAGSRIRTPGRGARAGARPSSPGLSRSGSSPPRPAALLERHQGVRGRDHPRCTVGDRRAHRCPSSSSRCAERRVDLMVAPAARRASEIFVAGPSARIAFRGCSPSRADHPLAGRSEVSLEDLADYEVTDTTTVMPPELSRAWLPDRAPSGRPMKRRRLQHHEWSELITPIARGRIVHPTVTTFPDHVVHPRRPLRADQRPAGVGGVLVWRGATPVRASAPSWRSLSD